MPVKLNRFALRLAFISLSFISVCALAAERDVRILHFEAVDIDFQSPAKAASKSAAGRTMSFAAFGKAYKIDLETNVRIALPRTTRAQAFRGSVAGRNNSWVRITRIGSEVHGLLFDGTELFAIEPAKVVASNSSGTAIFRLSDTQTDLGKNFCAAADAPNANGLQVFEALGRESKLLLTQMQQSGAGMRLEVSALMDSAFRQRYESDQAASDAIVARVNNIDGIFSSQLGVEIAVTQIASNELPGTIPTAATNPETLLLSVSQLRSALPNLYATGTTHLFTGRDLDGSTVGISYIDTVCSQKFGASLSEARDRGVWFDSLIAAHELGHSFGSPHDGQSQCAATPANYLMAPSINGSDQFSQCSLDIMRARVQTASCLIAIPMPDISVPTELGTYQAAQNQSFEWSLTVSNIGRADSQMTQAQIAVPAALTVTSAMVSGGTCVVGAGTVQCDLGTLAGSENRNVNLILNSSLAGTYSIAARVSAAADMTTTNNSASASVRIDPAVDVAISIAMPDTATIDQSLTATFTVSNKSSVAAPNLSVDIAVPSGVTISGVSQLDGVACQTQFQIVHCAMNSLAANRTVAGALSVVVHNAGAQTITAKLDGAYIDMQPQDNFAEKSVMVSGTPASAPALIPTAIEKTGGGALNLYALLALCGIALRRRVPQLLHR